jgi:uncharacterized protein YdiU (UPF0061 family)
MMAAKLGLKAFDPSIDEELNNELLDLLRFVETDMTIFYRKLSLLPMDVGLSNHDLMRPLMEAYYVPEQLAEGYRTRLGNWLRRYIIRVQNTGMSDEERCNTMNVANPKYVLRNYLAQLAIDKAEQGDFSMVDELLELLRHPYDEQPDKEAFASKRPDWARQRAGCSMLSCSS